MTVLKGYSPNYYYFQFHLVIRDASQLVVIICGTLHARRKGMLMKCEDTACYLCKGTENLTRDHIPPLNLFPKESRKNLITVPCCKECNEAFSKVDEQFRVFITAAANVSPTGTRMWREKVVGSTFQRSPALERQMGKDVFRGEMQTADGPVAVPLIAIDKSVLNPFFIRITKGLLATFYPAVDNGNLVFHIQQLNQFGGQHPTFQTLKKILVEDERGNGVFRFWRGTAIDKPGAGVWIYQFYDAGMFMVKHEP